MQIQKEKYHWESMANSKGVFYVYFFFLFRKVFTCKYMSKYNIVFETVAALVNIDYS